MLRRIWQMIHRPLPAWLTLVLFLSSPAAAASSYVLNGSVLVPTGGSVNATAGSISGNAANSVAGSGYTGPAVIAQATSQPTMQPGYPYTQAMIVQDGINGGIWNTCYDCALGAGGYTNSHWHLIWANYPGDTYGNSDIAIGGAALASGDAGTFGHNIAIGVGALEDSGGTIPGQNNVAIGFVTMRYADSTAAASNVSVGNSSGVCVGTGTENAFLGNLAGSGTCTGSEDTYSYNTALGYSSGAAFTTASNNALLGYQAGNSCSSCTYNTATGSLALGQMTTQTNNTAAGYDAGGQSAGNGGAFFGTSAGKNLAGDNNVALGYNAGRGAAASAVTQSVFLGYLSGSTTMASGTQNIAVGASAGSALTTGSSNTILGAGDSDITSGSTNTELGSGAAVPSATGNYQLSIMNAIFGASNTGFGSTVSTGCIAFYSKTCTNGTVNFAVPLVAANGAAASCTGGYTFVNGIMVITGAGAPTCTAPRGSEYLRSDGASGADIYISQGGGAWAAISGV